VAIVELGDRYTSDLFQIPEPSKVVKLHFSDNYRLEARPLGEYYLDIVSPDSLSIS
jgi:hypothetical protein